MVTPVGPFSDRGALGLWCRLGRKHVFTVKVLKVNRDVSLAHIIPSCCLVMDIYDDVASSQIKVTEDGRICHGRSKV